MNCKPRDLAVVVVSAKKGFDWESVISNKCIGLVVRVVSLTASGKWNLEKRIEFGPVDYFQNGKFWSAQSSWVDAIHDSCLQPIRGVRTTEETHDEVTA